MLLCPAPHIQSSLQSSSYVYMWFRICETQLWIIVTFCSALVIAGCRSCYQLYIHVVTPRKTSFVYLSSTLAPTYRIISIARLQYLQSITLSTSTSLLGLSFAPGPRARSTSTLVHLSQLSELSPTHSIIVGIVIHSTIAPQIALWPTLSLLMPYGTPTLPQGTTRNHIILDTTITPQVGAYG